MSFLFDETVFGPVFSRRLGLSLGINLLPNNRKWCNFDCIYCECGWSPKGNSIPVVLPTSKEVSDALELKLKMMQQAGQKPDVITFAGNGEPTLHPQFAEIIDNTIALRNLYAPGSLISVLSNATMLHKPEVVEALKKVDQNILKLDSGSNDTLRILNRPGKPVKAADIAEQMLQFRGRCIVQTLFVQGTFDGQPIDNTSPKDLEPWLKLIAEIRPSLVMIYTIDRDTPVDSLKKVPKKELQNIAAKVQDIGISTQVSG